ncbi:MAG TPA: cellulase family glycosylhydrolase [Silvibacterium sp.]|nr:cellulase family glycosylhydrolase [Silvibacterium sp.]
MRSPALLIVLLSTFQISFAQSPAFERAASLQHGINLSGWFASSGNLSQQHFDTFTNEADLKLIHEMGFDSVRLGVEPSLIVRHGQLNPANPEALAQLDRSIDRAIANHLAVMLCVFPDSDYKRNLANERGVDDFVLLWRVLAAHFNKADTGKVFFELMNEPEVPDPYRWMGIQARVVEAIRSLDTGHTIIATAANYGSLPDLLQLEPVRDANVIYNFHFYEPYQFTHQGASWGSSDWVFFKDIPYPATPDTLAAQMKNVPSDPARYNLFLYGAGGWDRQSISARIAFAAAWARERKVPLICNEFGAFRDTADPASRARWIGDVRSALEENHIGWAMWDYRGNFGVVERSDTRITPDPAILHALGLNANVQPETISTPQP